LTEDGNVEITGRNLQRGRAHGAEDFSWEGGPMKKIPVAMICLAVLLAGCGGGLRGDANAGPNPGGGFYGAPNIDIGRINP
jgi:hypothetical protein